MARQVAGEDGTHIGPILAAAGARTDRAGSSGSDTRGDHQGHALSARARERRKQGRRHIAAAQSLDDQPGDAGCDQDYAFEDLAIAIRHARIDLGIRVVFDQGIPMDREHHGRGNPHAAVGRILYTDVDGPAATDGILVYVKATLSGDEPLDVLNYSKGHPAFPHESTADQWFDEAQFESYRMLGDHSIEELVRGGDGGSRLSDFFDRRAAKETGPAAAPADRHPQAT